MIAYLIDALGEVGRAVPQTLQGLTALTPFAVEFRYSFLDDGATSPLDRDHARAQLKDLRTWVEAQIRSN